MCEMMLYNSSIVISLLPLEAHRAAATKLGVCQMQANSTTPVSGLTSRDLHIKNKSYEITTLSRNRYIYSLPPTVSKCPDNG